MYIFKALVIWMQMILDFKKMPFLGAWVASDSGLDLRIK